MVRKWLLDWAIELGYPRNIEIFPKQDTLDGIDAKGSGINLPYFGALGNVAIDAKGNDIALEAFLKDAKALRKDCLDDPTAQRERAARTFQPLWSWGNIATTIQTQSPELYAVTSGEKSRSGLWSTGSVE